MKAIAETRGLRVVVQGGKRIWKKIVGKGTRCLEQAEEKAIIAEYNAAKAAPKGGEYGKVRAGTKGGEVHHMPAAKVTPYPYRKAPASWMETADHRLTESWGSSARAKAWRQRQADLIGQGKLREAIQMDINDIRSKFGSKYDKNIKEMLDAFGFKE